MKVLLTVNKQRMYENYRVLVPKNPFQLEDDGIDNGELEALYVDHILSFVPFNQVEQGLAYLTRKVKIGGKFMVGCPDFTRISRDYLSFNLTLEQVNMLTANRTLLDAKFLETLFNKYGIEILRRDNINYDLLIIGERKV